MSIFLQLNLSNGQWFVDKDPEPVSVTLNIGFTSDTLPVIFDDLAFSYSCRVGDEIVQINSYPHKGITYLSTDQDFLVSEKIDLNADDEATITVWATNGGQDYNHSITFTVPRPEQPHPSWEWVDQDWKPPIPYPEDEGEYLWNEESQSWKPITNN